MENGPSVRIEGDTIIEAFLHNLERIPDRPAMCRRTEEGWETLTWADYGIAVSEVMAGLAELGIGPGRARRDLLQQPAGMALRRPRLAVQRLRDRAALPDQLTRAGGLHPRPRRRSRVLRRERRSARQGSWPSGTGSRSSTASSSSTTTSASTTRTSSASPSCARWARPVSSVNPGCSRLGPVPCRPIRSPRSSTRAARRGRPRAR